MNVLVNQHSQEKVGGLHCLIHYMLDETRGLEYTPLFGSFGYHFSTEQKKTKPYIVPVMSCCGVMYLKSTFVELGGWNKELGIYGGGESYINFKQGVCGRYQWIDPAARLWHYADKRGYSWNYQDYVRNYFIAAYTVGGEKWLDALAEQRIKGKKDRPEVINNIKQDVIEKCKDDREFIAQRQVKTYEEYAAEF